MTFSVVTLKAFGDFVIACSCARAARTSASTSALITSSHPTVIAGEYMRPLAAALGVESEIDFIGDKQWKDVPAIFDVRKRGLSAALRSLVELRTLLGKFPQDRKFVFDNAGIREFLLCPRRKLHHISKDSGNIYLGYQEFFRSTSHIVPVAPITPIAIARPRFSLSSVRKIILIPGSRLPVKVIPKSVIDTIYYALQERGYSVTVVTLEGESVDFSKNIPSICIPRTFENLIATIQESDWVIGADSLPSHLAEYFHVPQFIFAPYQTNFMLPQSVHTSGAWTTFDAAGQFARWLDAHP